jgi:hypothetical protein
VENVEGPSSPARQTRARSVDGLSTHVSLIVVSRNYQPASPTGLHPHPLGNAIDKMLSTINKILIDKLSIRSFC